MRTIAHISDLHFGRAEPAVLAGLRAALITARPDVVVVSGDLTQRARRREFEAARDFLRTLPQPQIVVPGNHDVPLYDAVARWLWPLAGFRRYIGPTSGQFYADDEIAVLGLNTARSLTFKNGRINNSQVAQACACFTPLAEPVIRIVVTHHPFLLPESEARHDIIGRARMAMAAFADCKVDLVLSGHLHASHAATSETLYAGPHAALLVQAGTATSSRRRSEPNAFNLLRADQGRVAIERHVWNDGGFAMAAREEFRRGEGGWARESEPMKKG
jgi:3',5'-cyclic AMP phosphodiesterase CpdA